MIVEKEDVNKTGNSCSFCNRGILKDHTHWPSLRYPYDKVYTFTRNGSSGLKAAICEDCVTELYNKIKKTK